MIEKIKELRAILPIPIVEAKQMLADNDGDIETCVLLYTAKALKVITEATGASNNVADKHYKAEKFDINRAISAIKDEIYDANYEPIAGVDTTSLQFVKDWIYIMESKDFGISLGYKKLQSAIDAMQLIPKLKDIASLLQKAKSEYDIVFEGYDDNLPLEDFVRRNITLDGIAIFQQASQQIPLQVLYIKNEVSRHWRNVQS